MCRFPAAPMAALTRPVRLALLALVAMAALVTPLFAAPLSAKNDPEALPGITGTRGSKDIGEAWLIAPTARYPHFVRGQQFEAGGLRVRMADGRVLTLMLDGNHVFEDRTARLADLDGDGRDEIILVLTSLDRGASLAVYEVRGEKIRLKAQTPDEGRPFRWLNPAGIADYTGDGRLDIALVQKPHLVKELQIWTLEGGKLVQLFSVASVSNHHNGSLETDLSASADLDGDGVTDLAIASGNYAYLRVFSFSGRRPQEIDRVALPSPVVGNFSLAKKNNGWLLRFRLADGQSFARFFSPDNA